MLVVGAYLTQAQWRHHNPPVFEWPTLYDNMIMPAWCALMFVVVAWSCDRAAPRTSAPIEAAASANFFGPSLALPTMNMEKQDD